MSGRVVVVGGSLGGLTAALLLRDLGWDVTVVERSATKLDGRGAGIVLHPATVRYIVDRIGRPIEEVGATATRLRYLGSDGTVLTDSPCQYRFSSYNWLYQQLLGRFGDERYELGAQMTRVAQDGGTVRVDLASGGWYEADLVVCADGVNSTARRQLFPDVSMRYAGYVGWRGTVEGDRLGADASAALRDTIAYAVLPRSHMLAYPIPGEGGSLVEPHLNWVWYRNVEAGGALTDLLTDRYGRSQAATVPPGAVADHHLAELRSTADRLLARQLRELVHKTREPFVQVVGVVAAPRMASGRVVLIGDAACALPPHAAAGTAKAADDAWSLADALAGAGDDLPARLAVWERDRLEVARRVLERSREAGRRSQFEGTWKVGDPLPFGLHEQGDSELPARSPEREEQR